MKTIIFRFGITLLAITLGVLLVSGMTLVGRTSSGPIDDFVTHVGSGVADIENELILHEREDSRSEALKWFDSYRSRPAKLAKPDAVLFGAYDNHTNESFESIVAIEKSVNTVFPLIHLYVAWGTKPEQEFPLAKAKAISELGSTPVITWEPWLTDFETEKYPNLPAADKRDKDGLKAIAKGDYDAYIIEWAKGVKKLDKPVFIRLGHEMNDPYRYPWGPQNNQPADFVAVWKHVLATFKTAGVKNALWVWAPHPAYAGFADYYPGDEYVDWVGTGTLNYGTVASWSKWWSFDEIFGKFYNQVTQYKKPVMITEFGCLNVGGNRANWYKDALTNLPAKYPAVKSVIIYHSSDDNTTTNKSLNWYIKDDVKATAAITKAVAGWKK